MKLYLHMHKKNKMNDFDRELNAKLDKLDDIISLLADTDDEYRQGVADLALWLFNYCTPEKLQPILKELEEEYP